MSKLPDWAIRSIKTFVQAFLGIVVPEVCAILNKVAEITDLSTAWKMLVPILCSALAAGICALWNGLAQKELKVEETK